MLISEYRSPHRGIRALRATALWSCTIKYIHTYIHTLMTTCKSMHHAPGCNTLARIRNVHGNLHTHVHMPAAGLRIHSNCPENSTLRRRQRAMFRYDCGAHTCATTNARSVATFTLAQLSLCALYTHVHTYTHTHTVRHTRKKLVYKHCILHA
jgi:hypothetical protein